MAHPLLKTDQNGKLDLSKRNVTREDITLIQKELTKDVRILNLNGAKISGLDLHLMGKKLIISTIKKLRMSSVQIYGGQVSMIRSYLPKTLTHLTLDNNRINDFYLSTLAEYLTKVEHLSLRRNMLGQHGARMLANMIKQRDGKKRCCLKSLNLDGNRIGDDGALPLIEEMKWNTTLIKLDLSGNQLTDRTATKVADLLEVNQSVIKLLLSRNSITNQGIEYLSQSLKVNFGLRSLTLLRNNSIGLPGIKSVTEMLKINYTLMSIRITNGKQIPEIRQLLKPEEWRKRRNRRETLQQKCARIIRSKKMDPVAIPGMIREQHLLRF